MMLVTIENLGGVFGAIFFSLVMHCNWCTKVTYLSISRNSENLGKEKGSYSYMHGNISIHVSLCNTRHMPKLSLF